MSHTVSRFSKATLLRSTALVSASIAAALSASDASAATIDSATFTRVTDGGTSTPGCFVQVSVTYTADTVDNANNRDVIQSSGQTVGGASFDPPGHFSPTVGTTATQPVIVRISSPPAGPDSYVVRFFDVTAVSSTPGGGPEIGVVQVPRSALIAEGGACAAIATLTNAPPIVDAGPDQTAAGSSSVVLDGSNSSDPDADNLTYTWLQSSGPGAVGISGANTPTATIITPPKTATQQTMIFDLSVNDGTITSVDSVSVFVEANQLPTADAGPDQTVPQGTAVALDSSASADPDGDGVSTWVWTQTGGPTVTLTGANTPNPTFTAPSVTGNTPLTFSLQVGDTFGTQPTADTVTITVTPNVPPTVDAGPDQTVQALSSVQLNGTANDPEGDALTYQWTQTSGVGVTLSGDTTLTPTFTAPQKTNSPQVLTFELVANDGTANSSPDTVTVTIPANQAPVADAGSQQNLSGGETVNLDGSASSDPDGDPIVFYQWNQISGPPATITGANTATPTVVVPAATNSAQTLTFELTVADGFDATDAATVDLVIEANEAPVADAGPDQTVSPGTTVTLDSSGSSDPDGDSFSTSWTQVSGASVTLSDPNAVSPTFIAPPSMSGQQALVFEVTVNDSFGRSSTDQVTITIPANGVPIANAGPDQNVTGGNIVSLDGTASSDPDGDRLRFNWTQTGGPNVTLNDPSTPAPSFVAPSAMASAQQLTFALRVEDDFGASTLDEVVITVDANAPPVADAGQDQTVSGGSPVTLDGSGSTDPEGDAIQYSWVQTGGANVSLTGANTANPTFTAPLGMNNAQTLTFELTVTDGTTGQVGTTAEVDIIVEANNPPTAEAGSDQGPIDSGATVTLDGSGSSDPDGDALTYVWTQVSGTPVSLTGGSTARPTFVAPLVNGTEDLVFQLVVNDGQVDSRTDTVTIGIRAQGNITIIQQLVGTDTSVAFTSNLAALSGTIVTTGGVGQLAATAVSAGSYSITAADLSGAGYALVGITCNDTDSVINVATRSVGLELSPNEDLICTFSMANSREAAVLSINKFLTGRNALILATQPDLQRRLDRLQGNPASGGSASAYGLPVPGSGKLPFNATLSEGQARFSTSLAMASSLSGSPSDRGSKPFDIWAEAYFSSARIGDQDGSFSMLYTGADYLVTDDLLIGGLIGFDRFSDRDTLEIGEAEGDGWLAGPYITARLSPQLYAEARAAWGKSDNAINALGSFTDSFDTTRSYYSGSLIGQFDLGEGTVLQPEVTVRQISETTKPYTDSLGIEILSQKVSQGDLAFKPRVSHRIELPQGWTLRPYGEVEGIYTFGVDAPPELSVLLPQFDGSGFESLRARAEAGFDFFSQSGFRGTVSAFHDGIGNAGFRNTGVQLGISFGF